MLDVCEARSEGMTYVDVQILYNEVSADFKNSIVEGDMARIDLHQFS